MKIEFVNRSRAKVPTGFLRRWTGRLERELLRQGILPMEFRGRELTLVFVGPCEMAALNRDYRGKNSPTDVLSFEGDRMGVTFGELVLCPHTIRRSREGLSYRLKLGYRVLHGVLHLLGYDHEAGGEEAREMMKLQDELFDLLREWLGPWDVDFPNGCL